VLIVVAAVASPSLGRAAHMTLLRLAAQAGFIFVAVGLPSLVDTVGKRLIGRARPPLYRTTGTFDFTPFSWRAEYASMPSGHATTVFAAAIAIGVLFPRARVFMWVYAGLVVLSRPVLAAHYPSDVVAGAIVGAAGALLVRQWFALRGLGFAFGQDGRVRTLPGPSLARIKKVARRVVGP
jgi:membrane-associated phospholipid phosphatase